MDTEEPGLPSISNDSRSKLSMLGLKKVVSPYASSAENTPTSDAKEVDINEFSITLTDTRTQASKLGLFKVTSPYEIEMDSGQNDDMTSGRRRYSAASSDGGEAKQASFGIQVDLLQELTADETSCSFVNTPRTTLGRPSCRASYSSERFTERFNSERFTSERFTERTTFGRDRLTERTTFGRDSRWSSEADVDLCSSTRGTGQSSGGSIKRIKKLKCIANVNRTVEFNGELLGADDSQKVAQEEQGLEEAIFQEYTRIEVSNVSKNAHSMDKEDSCDSNDVSPIPRVARRLYGAVLDGRSKPEVTQVGNCDNSPEAPKGMPRAPPKVRAARKISTVPSSSESLLSSGDRQAPADKNSAVSQNQKEAHEVVAEEEAGSRSLDEPIGNASFDPRDRSHVLSPVESIAARTESSQTNLIERMNELPEGCTDS